jgi:hypothetical protein
MIAKMKKKNLVIMFLIGLTISSCSNDKTSLKKFADDVVNNSFPIEQVIDNHIICDENSKFMTVLQLKYFRIEFEKRPSNIVVYSFKEAQNQNKEIEGIITNDYNKVFFIYFNDTLKMSLLLNENSKIIAISTLNKGGKRFFMRTDGNI